MTRHQGRNSRLTPAARLNILLLHADPDRLAGVADLHHEVDRHVGLHADRHVGALRGGRVGLQYEVPHGAGSEHKLAGGNGKFIITPKNLTPERETQICASCHTRANSKDMDAHGLENPLDINNKMPKPGISRADFLANNVKNQDNSAYWADGKHVKKHHEQVQDFIQTKKYRNATQLMTCVSCHDVHGPGTDRHQLSGTSNGTLCTGCHTANTDVVAHMTAKTGLSMGASTKCIDCHATKTAKSGSGNPVAGRTGASGTKYYQNDITSHLFDVPNKSTVSPTNAMPIPYTNSCGGCHSSTAL